MAFTLKCAFVSMLDNRPHTVRVFPNIRKTRRGQQRSFRPLLRNPRQWLHIVGGGPTRVLRGQPGPKARPTWTGSSSRTPPRPPTPQRHLSLTALASRERQASQEAGHSLRASRGSNPELAHYKDRGFVQTGLPDAAQSGMGVVPAVFAGGRRQSSRRSIRPWWTRKLLLLNCGQRPLRPARQRLGDSPAWRWKNVVKFAASSKPRRPAQRATGRSVCASNRLASSRTR
jgi:hypothetical protein